MRACVCRQHVVAQHTHAGAKQQTHKNCSGAKRRRGSLGRQFVPLRLRRRPLARAAATAAAAPRLLQIGTITAPRWPGRGHAWIYDHRVAGRRQLF